MLSALVGLFPARALAQEINIPKLTHAIYTAEGGDKAQFPYGIRSIKCNSKAECKRICENTIKNNIKRHKKSLKKGDNRDFLTFLRDRYCPIKGKLSKAEKKLNKHWLDNVRKLYR